MAIGEIFLGSFCQVLLDKLTSLGLDYVLQERINTTSLHMLKGMLETINAMLDDAEDKQLSDDRLMKLWFDDVRDLAYDIEDLLHEFEIEAGQAKPKAESSTSGGQLKRKFSLFSRSCSLMSETKSQEMKGRFEEIISRKAFLSLRENVVHRSHYTNKRLPSTSLPELQFFGREEEEAQVLELLIGDVQNSDANLSIVPIVGMGGVGKTALVQQLYNHVRVKSYFERRVWVCVSDFFDVLNITKTILRSVTGLPCEGEDLNGLQVKLKDSLSEKKFLVILDDVWNEKYGEWTALLKPFEAGAKGSKIIVTTRNHSVVSITGASPYPLKELSLDNCTSLLAHHALGERNFGRHAYLEAIGKKLAEKCKGLPLAAKILGGLLRNKENLDEWEAILNNRIWDAMMEKNDEVLPALKLSYVHLPSYLKRCFAYCAIFPKDYEIERHELVLLWIAEGFLDGRKAKENILSLGWNYFDELVSRSFLQQSSVNTSKFLMHDLLNDLAKSIAGGICFTSRESQQVDEEDDASLDKKALYASFISSWYVTSRCLRAYDGMKVLRSLIILRDGIGGGSRKFSISNKVLYDLLTKLKYLKVFSLCYCSIIEVPECVSDLNHLRYLNFSYTDIERLPESIDALCKLQALILRGCQKLSMLPPGITKLVNLQFLDLRDTSSLKKMPLGIGNLKNIIILSKFVVEPEKGSKLKELKNLQNLQGEFFISELQKVEEVRDAIDANLFRKQGLSNLFLSWNKNFGNFRNIEHEARVLHSLRPHTNLESLTISYYGGGIFPSWLNGPSYSKIVSLCLRGCPNVRSLPSLGQLPSLRELSIEGLHVVSMIGSEFCGTKRPFPSLTTLKFEEMSAWKDWSIYVGGQEEEVPFSCLQHLVVRRCPKLMGTLPCQLDHLIKLEIHSCSHLNNSTSVIHLPSLCDLHLRDCNKEILKSLVNLTSLTILKIENLSELICFDKGFISHLVKLKELHIRSCDKLTYLWQDGDGTRNLICLQELAIRSCPQFTSFVVGEGEILKIVVNIPSLTVLKIQHLPKLVCFDHGFMSSLVKLKELEIISCDKLTYLWQDGNETQNLTCLQSLAIESCPQFTSFVGGEGEIELPCNLEKMELKNCTSLEKLPSKMHTLRDLSIRNCPKIMGQTIPPDDLSSNNLISQLESLKISKCDSMTFFPLAKARLAALKTLHISECEGVESLEEIIVESLKSLDISTCVKLGSLPRCLHTLSHLTKLEIWNCPALDIDDFPPLPITLSKLTLCKCPKIKFLPNQWHNLTSLHSLQIWYCQNIKCFPEGGLPPNLQSLEILGCENLKSPMREWGLHLLASLELLQIDFGKGGEGEGEWFPWEDKDAWSLLFPSSLTELYLRNMRNVESLSSGLRSHLSSLQQLWIRDCPKLRYLPKMASLLPSKIYTYTNARF
ncbi:putative disease resistance RPP13-like protein 1 [Eucalyptus grandis]|uniref:putative disease resistance RPP13-like protein 1 n=1 Tax=Eucalyptus grandis TaxID=71139 RepID=UPI00192EEF58|nr:putative disease resistance RPP13-like protein 1 [Eucalyptus grandis]